MSIDVQIRHRLGAFVLDVSFQINAPGITTLFGPSGSGKTTTVNAVAGLLRPDEGRIAVNGRTVFDSKAGLSVAPHQRRIGYVFQDNRLFPHLTVEENLRFGWRRNGGGESGYFDEIVGLMGLTNLMRRRPAGLSGGEAGRVALGRALLARPSLLLLDEPLAALDIPRRLEILPYLERLRDEARLPMIYVTHSVEELSRLADRVVVLKDGRVTAQSRVFDLVSDLAFSALTGLPAYGAVLDARVGCERAEDQLTVLTFAGGELVVPRVAQPLGARLRVRIRAEDVLLANGRPEGISANNVLPVIATAISTDREGHADVQLTCGRVRLVSRITRASLLRLGIVEGMTLFAIVKSVTIDRDLGTPAV